MSKPARVEVPAVPVVAEQWAGSGSPIVLLHAGVCDRRSWHATAERLAGCGPIVAYDRRGFGESPAALESFRHVENLLGVLERVARDEPAWLVGSSMGGQVALDAALRRPDRVRGLVLIAPAISGAPEPDELDPNSQRLSDLLDAAYEAQDRDEVNRVETWLYLDGPAAPEGRVHGAARDLALAMNEIVLRNNVPETAGASNEDAWQRLEDVKVPVTVAWGELDMPFPAPAVRTPGRVPPENTPLRAAGQRAPAVPGGPGTRRRPHPHRRHAPMNAPRTWLTRAR